jgi:hypothetical protein
LKVPISHEPAIAVGQVGLPLSQRFKGCDETPLVVANATVDEPEAALFALPVVGADILEAHGGGLPLVVGAHYQGGVVAIGFDGLQKRQELFPGCGLLEAQLVKDVLVVEEAVYH